MPRYGYPDGPAVGDLMSAPPQPTVWYAESLRLSFLGIPEWVQRPLFAEIAEVPPAQTTTQLPLRLHQETGGVSDAFLSVSQQADRVDIILSDQPTRNTVNPIGPDYRPLFWIGPFRESLEIFDLISARTIPLIPRTARMAYAITLVCETESARAALTCLRRYLPTVDFNPENDSDLLFQINRPIRNERGQLINRLSRWQSTQTARVRVAATLPLTPSVEVGAMTFAAHAYIDISTDANNTVPFVGTELASLIERLRAYAVEIAEHGDQT